MDKKASGVWGIAGDGRGKVSGPRRGFLAGRRSGNPEPGCSGSLDSPQGTSSFPVREILVRLWGKTLLLR